jgi:hypothetical protein
MIYFQTKKFCGEAQMMLVSLILCLTLSLTDAALKNGRSNRQPAHRCIWSKAVPAPTR